MLELTTLRLQARRMLVALGFVAATVLSLAPTARAELAIAADFEALMPLDIDDVKTAPGFGIRLGYQLHLPLLAITPELGYKWASFKNGAVINRGIAGARFAIGEVFRFGVSAHLGFGHRSEEYQAVEHTNLGMSFDGGLFLDLTVIPLLDVGAHIDYGRLAGDATKGLEVLQWVTFGLHVALII